MRRFSPFFLFCGMVAAAEIHGTVLDPTGAAIPGAQVSVFNRVGVVAQTSTGAAGAFELKTSDSANRLVITAAGFETRSIAVDSSDGEALEVRLDLAPQVDSVRVAGSALDLPLSEQGASISLIPNEEIRERNEAQALELLRYLPGVAVGQSGGTGGQASLFIRGGNSNFNLVQIDGVTVNRFGGGFDFAHIPTDWLERIEVIRGPQSALYGAYANSGVVNLVPRSAENSPTLDVLAEGGSHQTRRFSAGSAGTLFGFGVAAFASRLDSNGPVQNSDYHNENVAVHVTRAFSRQFLSLNGNFNSNDTGVPGPYGSDPAGLYAGIDTVSRNKNSFSNYLGRYQIDLSGRVREEVFGSYFGNNGYFTTPYGDSYNNDRRLQAESRTVVSLSSSYTMAFGVSFAREQVKNTYISDNSFEAFPLHRDETGLYWENRFQMGRRLFWNAGLRADVIHTPLIPANSGSGRPEFAADTITKVNPKVGAAFVLRAGGNGIFGSTRIHGSLGTGLRPPDGLELAFTNNPALKPERTASVDFGISQRFFHNTLSLDGTWFYSHFSDLIVSLGGDLARLGSYQSDNLANSLAQGVELSAHLRPARWVTVTGSYTYLHTEIQALDGSSGLAPNYFRVGQELIRRPAHSGAFVSSLSWRRVEANLTGYFRGAVLDVEPNYGASAGLYWNPGFADIGINLNYRLVAGLVAYGNLRNALNQYYEETYGYPSPRLNFVAGLKWSFTHGR
jgi:outer membrane cobalamin receptor